MYSDTYTPTEDEAPISIRVRLGLWSRAVFTPNHKGVGVQYGLTALGFLSLGYALAALLGWQMASPGHPLPVWHHLFGTTFSGESSATPGLQDWLGAVHGTVMVFLVLVPIEIGAFGNYLVPLQIGAADTAFPRLNRMGYWAYLIGGVFMVGSLVVPSVASPVGNPNTAPAGFPMGIAPRFDGQTLWLFGLLLVSASLALLAVTLITTIVQLRGPGLTWRRLPFFVWTQLVASLLLLLAAPPLVAAGVLQLTGKLAGTPFFQATGLLVGSHPSAGFIAGNSEWSRYLYWFLAHPERAALVLPAIGIVAEVIADNTGKAHFGFKMKVGSTLAIGGGALVVWAHHANLVGMGTTLNPFFRITSALLFVPWLLLLASLVFSLWGAKIRFTVPMLFALAFLPLFGMGLCTGLPLMPGAANLGRFEPTNFVASIHLMGAAATFCALCAGLYFWFPKLTGHPLDRFWGKVHVTLSMLFLILALLPLLLEVVGREQALLGQHASLNAAGHLGTAFWSTLNLNRAIVYAIAMLGLAQIPLIYNCLLSLLKKGPIRADSCNECLELSLLPAHQPD